MSRCVTIDEASLPRLARHVKLRFDERRECWVMLAPERILMPDDIAVEIVRRCDGETTVGAIIEALAAEFDAPVEEVGADVVELLQDLADKGFVAA
ncbi:MAG: pyrroloquinoline quinone biosynthesis peptide chaperone PqqD [Alphaproteobacteria bacterium]